MIEKVCTKCGKKKLLTEFYRYKKTRNGRYFSCCKSCSAEYRGCNYLKDIKRNCRYCGKEFQPTRSTQWYCPNNICFKLARRNYTQKTRGFHEKKYEDNFWKNNLWLHNEPTSEYIGNTGYVVCIFGYVSIHKHRLIMMREIGRKLETWEHIHHKNGIKTDNRLENLELVSGKEHLCMTQMMQENRELKNRVFTLEEEMRNLKAMYKLQGVA